MDELVYSILYKKELIETNDFHYLFYPCYVVKGIYDKDSNLFLDEINKSRYSYNNTQVIFDESNYCVGDIYSEKDLHKMFPDSNNIDDLEKKLFEQEEKYLTIGKYDEINDLLKINKCDYNDVQLENSMSRDMEKIIIGNDGKDEDEEEYSRFYLDFKEEFGYDFIMFTKENLEDINKLDDIEQIHEYIYELQINKSSYEKNYYNSVKNDTSNRKTILCVPEEIVEDLYAMDSVEKIKEFINDNFPQEKAITEMLKDTELNEFKNLKSITEKELNKINKDTDIDVIKKDLRSILEHYKEKLYTTLYLNSIGYEFYSAMTYYNIQVQCLYDILKSDDINKIKKKYISLYKATIPNLEKVEKEFTFTDEFNINFKVNQESSEDSINLAIEEATNKLNKLIGLQNVKETFDQIFSSMLFEKRTSNNLKLEDDYKHMVFTGNPGTGKTTVAEIVAPLFYRMGYLKSDKIAYVAAQDLIGKYVGQTAPKTEEVIKKNSGGLIVLDEAYILAGVAQQFGNEAITVMLKEMEKNNTMFIFAGYKKEMEDFMSMNSGLHSRIGTFVEFNDYNEEELLEIFNQTINNTNLNENQEKKLTITPEALTKVKEIIHSAYTQEDFGNARFVKKLFSTISKQHAKNTRNNPSEYDLYTIVEKDVAEDILDKILFSKTSSEYRDSTIGFTTEIKSKQKVKKISDYACRTSNDLNNK